MQSQLAAALLGHGNNAGATAAADNDDEKDVVEPDEDADDVDEFIDEVFIVFTKTHVFFILRTAFNVHGVVGFLVHAC